MPCRWQEPSSSRTDGTIRLPYYYDHIADHPSVDLLLHGVMGMDWNQTFNGPVAP